MGHSARRKNHRGNGKGKPRQRGAVFNKRFHPPGTTPGTLLQHEEPQIPARLSLIEYDAQSFEELPEIGVEACKRYLASETVTWIHVQGAADVGALRRLGETFGLHPLALEDVANSGQRPKIERYDDQLFLILSQPHFDEERIEFAQISLFVGKNYLISFHSGTQDPFDLVRQRLRQRRGRIRERRVDHLLYALLDAAIDTGFPVLERIGIELEELEVQLLESPVQDALRRLHTLRRDALLMRRLLWPQRELVSQLLRDGNDLIEDETRLYFRDCHDHAIQILDLLETYRDMTTGMLDLYLSSNSNRLNEVMRVLTVIATIFIPLTFVVGVYGMNFGNKSDSPWNMPELNWYYGYPILWMIMIAIAGGMVYFFRRRGWF